MNDILQLRIILANNPHNLADSNHSIPVDATSVTWFVALFYQLCLSASFNIQTFSLHFSSLLKIIPHQDVDSVTPGTNYSHRHLTKAISFYTSAVT